MKTGIRTIGMTLALCFVAAVATFAADANMGTWKLNEAKSTIAPGAAKNNTVVYEAAGANVKVIIDGIDGAGKPMHNEWVGMFDGKDYPVTGDSSSDARSYTRVNANTLTFTLKKDGKVTLSGRIEVSADGKSRTVTSSGTNAKGEKISSTAVFDKQ